MPAKKGTKKSAGGRTATKSVRKAVERTVAASADTTWAPPAPGSGPALVGQGQYPGPQIGDAVWWARKQVACVVTQRDDEDPRIVIFQGGPIVRNNRGREVPRYTVGSRDVHFRWITTHRIWVLGKGALPPLVNGVVRLPEPRVVDKQAIAAELAAMPKFSVGVPGIVLTPPGVNLSGGPPHGSFANG